MRVFGEAMRTIRPLADGTVEIIDQTRLPWSLEHVRLARLADAAHAIADMLVRGAPLIGVTAVNLAWALARTGRAARPHPPQERADVAFCEAGAIAEEDVDACRRIGEAG